MIKKISACIFLFTFNVFSQSTQPAEVKALKMFDAIITAKNTGLINGIEYSNKYNSEEGFDQYYKSSKFLLGNLVYDNQHYFDVHLLYDLYSDDLVYILYENDLVLYIKLIKDKVSYFAIDDKSFTRLSNKKEGVSGYFEIVYKQDEITLYKKHHKSISKRIDLDRVYYKFLEKPSYFLGLDNSYHKLVNKRSIIKLFPDKKRLINKFYSKNNFSLKNNVDQFMVNLFRDVISD